MSATTNLFCIRRSMLAGIPRRRFSDLRRDIMKPFTPKSSLILRFEFATIIKATNESVTEFSRRIARAAEGCKFTDRDDRMRDKFITGFNNGEKNDQTAITGT